MFPWKDVLQVEHLYRGGEQSLVRLFLGCYGAVAVHRVGRKENNRFWIGVLFLRVYNLVAAQQALKIREES